MSNFENYQKHFFSKVDHLILIYSAPSGTRPFQKMMEQVGGTDFGPMQLPYRILEPLGAGACVALCRETSLVAIRNVGADTMIRAIQKTETGLDGAFKRLTKKSARKSKPENEYCSLFLLPEQKMDEGLWLFLNVYPNLEHATVEQDHAMIRCLPWRKGDTIHIAYLRVQALPGKRGDA